MEVHTHTHTARKKWTHYFWEFFMLFLAVTLGFLVENQREHLVEHRRERQYIRSLLEDLKNDTAELRRDIAFWTLQSARMDTLREELDQPSAERNNLVLYAYAGYMRWYDKFVYHDRTIAQLKNGGNFRLIRSFPLADSLIEYDAHVITVVRDIETISNDMWQQLNYLQNKLFNSKYHGGPLRQFNLDSAVRIDSRPIGIRPGTDNEVFEYYNMLGYFQGLNIVRNQEYALLLTKSNNLIDMIKREYHLE